MKRLLALAAGLLAALVAPPAWAVAADPIMALADVRPGMRCTALSVIRGTTISEFDAEVIDVVRGDPESSGPRILIRVSGPAVEATGLGPGFSGSPIYCPDASGVPRNAGAVSFGVGDYGNKLALATPIELILGQRPEAPRGSRPAPRLLRSARPIATPLTVGGLSGPVRTRFLRAARRAGRPVLAAPSGPLAGFPVQDLRPGSAVSTALSSGDITLGGVGTVAYRDGSAIWAFGHPFDGVGRRSMLLQDAYVYAVVDNPLGLEEASTYKLAVPGHTVGSLTNDTLNAVIGRLGAPPRTVPLKVSVRDLDTGRASTLDSLVTDESDLELGSSLELVSTAALAQASLEALGAEPPSLSSSMCVRVVVRERRRPLGFCNDYLDAGRPFEDLSTATLLVHNFRFGRLTPVSAAVRMRVRRGVPDAFLLGARGPRRARAGSRVRIVLSLRRSRGRRFTRSFRFRVPPASRSGQRVLRLSGTVPQPPSDGSEEAFEVLLDEDPGGSGPDKDGSGPRSLRSLARRIARLGRREGLHGTFSARGRGPVVLPTPRLRLRGTARVPLRVVGRR